MMTVDRTQAPAAHPIESIQLIEPARLQMDNQLPVWTISSAMQPVVKVEITFNAGSAYHSNPLIPSFTSAMLQEGTAKRSAREIMEAIDNYGAFLEVDHDKDFASLTLFTLNRHLDKTLPIVLEMLSESVFPQLEWEILRSNRLDKYRINLGKVSFLAGKAFQELIFDGTAYGTPFSEQDYLNADTDQIRAFWNKHYSLANARIFVSGDVSPDVESTLQSVFGKVDIGVPDFEKALPEAGLAHARNRELFIEKPEAIQSAIRIGRRLFRKDHPEYFGMKVLTTVLGGYFGSRLMSNIREDKGYTYGIGAGTAAYRNDGYFYISTEVGADVCRAALKEIYKEIRILQEELIDEEELSLVKNYLLGNLLKSFDGPFERMERFKGALLYGVDHSFYHGYTQAIRMATPESLRELARTWLQKEDLKELVAGKR